MDYFIILVATVSGLYFHWWLYRRIQRWTDRDLALSFGGKDPAKRDYMLSRLQEAQRQGVKRKELDTWLKKAAEEYQAA